ncbi:lipid-binding SYLF domain-containing protein [Algihabitans albus]|uniref:lipid-binding SYLF domain-containing protein n=1 Tax=Algihabitans albus TaxID=2164067 RepID=UPI0035D0D9A7
MPDLRHPSRRRFLGMASAVATSGALLSLTATPTAAQDGVAQEASQLVDQSALTAESLLRDPNFSELQSVAGRAKAILIFPQILKAGFILGAEGGRGVLLVRGGDGSWSPPAFYTLAAGSIGLQIGGQVSELVMTVMNDGALAAMMRNKVQLGAELSVAVGPVGKGAEAATTTNLNSDVIAFSKTVGLFGGGALEGAGLIPNHAWNRAYYNAPPATPETIVLERRFYNMQADRLRQALPQPQGQSS